MASEILGLFNTPSVQQLRNAALDSSMISPAQMGSQGLLQQVVSMGQNAGAMMGEGAGQLLGGKVAGEVQASYLDEAIKYASQQGGTPLEKLSYVADFLETKPEMAGVAMAFRNEAANKELERQKKQADIAATKALAAQRTQLKDRSTAAERNRQAIVELEVKLQSNQELTPREISVARYLLAQESKPKSWTDKDTGEVVTIEAFDVNSAAPNVAKLLGKGGEEDKTSGATTTSTPSSEKIKKENIKALERSIGDIEGDLRNVDKATNLTGILTTGRIGAVIGAVDPGSEARALEESLGSIKAATAFNSLRSLRESSKSGSSGLGQVTEIEFKALQDRMTSLRKESPTYKADLAYVKAKWTELKERAMNDLAALKGEKLPFPNVKSVGEKYEESPGQATGKIGVGETVKIGGIEVRRVN